MMRLVFLCDQLVFFFNWQIREMWLVCSNRTSPFFFFLLLEQEKTDNRSHLQVVKLLAYISDKDLFAEFYR
ncbi:hypothetical protein MTR67_003525 [Solanum verrucosum]|uniref:Uncharacterized protein n=1 Tax=Solanum verrucosum TaxID=315347 RepID=A0AAF0PVS1_SOLVR|nr:hypothetical protein MTR67_003525 [Solanum verrucosum]